MLIYACYLYGVYIEIFQATGGYGLGNDCETNDTMLLIYLILLMVLFYLFSYLFYMLYNLNDMYGLYDVYNE
jgi:hypothetical protein